MVANRTNFQNCSTTLKAEYGGKVCDISLIQKYLQGGGEGRVQQ